MSDLQFGIDVPTSAAPGRDPVATALLAEELDFDFISSIDHPLGEQLTFETWTMLTWLAASTSTIRVATRVLGVPFRYPALIAKMAETLNRLSGGRLILGLGAGSMESEIAAIGAPALTPGEKIRALDEAVSIVRGLWNGPAFSFEGKHHHADGVTITPRPDGRIPIWLGTFGPKALELTGRVADGWIPSLGYAGAAALPGMRDRVVAAAVEAGRPPDAVHCILNVEMAPGSDTNDHVIGGTSPEIVDQLGEFVAMGFDGFNFKFAPHDPHRHSRVVAEEVIPALSHVRPGGH